MGIVEKLKSLLGGAAESSVEIPMQRRFAGSREEIAQELRGEIAERSDVELAPDAIDPNEALYDAGYVDSMSAITLLSFIQERYAVDIPEVDLVGRLSTLNALVDRIHAETRPSEG